MTKALFQLGKFYITPGALAACEARAMPPPVLITRHATGDWSEMSEDDRQANRQAIEDGLRILSAYQVGGRRFFVITEADRSSTTILLAEEY
jgi:hypothetical protein